MFWERCTAIEQFQSPPSARVGHVALAVDATASWGEELLLIHGGLSDKKAPLGDLVVLQVGLLDPRRPYHNACLYDLLTLV